MGSPILDVTRLFASRVLGKEGSCFRSKAYGDFWCRMQQAKESLCCSYIINVAKSIVSAAKVESSYYYSIGRGFLSLYASVKCLSVRCCIRVSIEDEDYCQEIAVSLYIGFGSHVFVKSHATVTYTSISSAERSWSIPAMDPYEEAALQALEQAPPSPDYVPEGDDEGEESSEDDDDDDEEEEHLAPTNFTLHVIDSVPLTEETEPFETDELLDLCHLWQHLLRHSLPTPPSPPPSPLSPLSFPLPQIPSPPLPVPSPPLFLPSADHRSDIPKANMPFQKRLCLTAPAPRFEVGESSAAVAARQTGLDLTYGTDYGFIDTLDANIRDAEARSPTILEEYNGTHLDDTANNPKPSNQGYYVWLTALAAMEQAYPHIGSKPRNWKPYFTCSYKEFHSCMQGNFNGTKGAVRLTRWFEKLESIFQVSKVADSDNVKYAACIMLDCALTWWNSLCQGQ
ncbi:hypothetical protein Tco_0902280 [Tanacetum coccineum]